MRRKTWRVLPSPCSSYLDPLAGSAAALDPGQEAARAPRHSDEEREMLLNPLRNLNER